MDITHIGTVFHAALSVKPCCNFRHRAEPNRAPHARCEAAGPIVSYTAMYHASQGTHACVKWHTCKALIDLLAKDSPDQRGYMSPYLLGCKISAAVALAICVSNECSLESVSEASLLVAVGRVSLRWNRMGK